MIFDFPSLTNNNGKCIRFIFSQEFDGIIKLAKDFDSDIDDIWHNRKEKKESTETRTNLIVVWIIILLLFGQEEAEEKKLWFNHQNW